MHIVSWKLFLWLIRTAGGRIVASSFSHCLEFEGKIFSWVWAFLLPLGILRRCWRWDYNIEISFSMRMSQRGHSNPASCQCIWWSMGQIWGVAWRVWGTFSQECKRFYWPVAGQQDSFISDLLSPGQARSDTVKRKYKLSYPAVSFWVAAIRHKGYSGQ